MMVINTVQLLWWCLFAQWLLFTCALNFSTDDNTREGLKRLDAIALNASIENDLFLYSTMPSTNVTTDLTNLLIEHLEKIGVSLNKSVEIEPQIGDFLNRVLPSYNLQDSVSYNTSIYLINGNLSIVTEPVRDNQKKQFYEEVRKYFFDLYQHSVHHFYQRMTSLCKPFKRDWLGLFNVTVTQ